MAYRTAPEPDQPFVNPYLERLLLEEYGKQNRTHLFLFWFCFVVASLVAAWVLITRPDEFWLTTPVVAVGIPSVIGVVISDVILLVSRRQHLLSKLRAGIQIRRVQRGTHTIHARIDGEPAAVVKEIPTIFVELVDGRVSTLQSPSDKQLARIEELLRMQMARVS